jgi:segregation and condensation protein A
MKAFERVVHRYNDRKNRLVHTVVKYEYTMEDSRDYLLQTAREQKTLSFEKIFDVCENRVHAIFLFLSVLELVQQKFLKILIGEGKNNFIIEYNEPENRLAELSDGSAGEQINQPQ